MNKSERWMLRIAIALVVIFGIIAIARVALPSSNIASLSTVFPKDAAEVVQSVSTDADSLKCATEVELYRDHMRSLIDEWQDATELANNAPRIALSPHIATLQEIRRRAKEIQPDRCLALAHLNLVLLMDETIAGYIAFLGREPDSEVNRHFEMAVRYTDNFLADLEEAAKK